MYTNLEINKLRPLSAEHFSKHKVEQAYYELLNKGMPTYLSVMKLEDMYYVTDNLLYYRAACLLVKRAKRIRNVPLFKIPCKVEEHYTTH